MVIALRCSAAGIGGPLQMVIVSVAYFMSCEGYKETIGTEGFRRLLCAGVHVYFFTIYRLLKTVSGPFYIHPIYAAVTFSMNLQ
jgi:hypothetical protein